MKTEHRQRFLLPHEYLGSVTSHPTISEALRRAWPALLIVLAVPVAVYVWRGLCVGHWGWSFIGVAISGGFGYTLWHALVTGYTHNNHGEFLRSTRPVGYWLSILFLILGYSVGIGGLIFAHYPNPQ